MSELRNPYEGWMRGCGTASAISTAGMLVAIGVQHAGGVSKFAKEIAFIVALICGSLLALFLLIIPVVYFMGRSALKDIRELVVEGNHWAHWHYSQDEWHRFAESEWARMRKKARTLPLKVLGIFLVVGALLAFTGKDLTLTAGILFGGAIGIPLGLLVGALTYLFGKSTYKRRLASVGEVYIGPKGVYQDGSYTGLKGFGLTLEKVEIQPSDPPVLHFEVKDSRGRRTTTTEVRVAVPRGREQEATALIQRFSAQT